MANALAYKPKEKLGKFPQGIAKIRVGKKSAKITFLDDNIEFEDGDNAREFDLSDLPKYPRLMPESAGEFFVKLNRDKDEIMSIGPVEGMFKAKVVDLSRRKEDEPPAPYEITGTAKDSGREFSYLAFNAYFEIERGPFKGVRISQFHHYKFAEGADGEAIWDGNVDNSKAKWLPKLVEFCEKVDCVSEPIEWPKDGNVLPELLDRILAADKTINIVVKGGYIDSLIGNTMYDEDDDEPKKVIKSKAPVKVNGHKPAAKPVAKKSKRNEL